MRLAVIVACIGMFLSTLDSGVINVALPYLTKYFDAPLSLSSWTISLYFLMLSGTIVIFGKVGDRFGRVKTFTHGFFIFGASSALCACSTSIYMLIVARGLQGIGAAMLQATAPAVITTLLPEHKKAHAIGLMGLVIGLGPVLGPAVSGFFISLLSWRWIFWINLPFCIAGILIANRICDTAEREAHPLDMVSILIFLVGIFSLALAILLLSDIRQNSMYIAWSLVFFVIFVVVYVIHSKKVSKNPLINLDHLVNYKFILILLSTFTFGLVTATILILPPIFLNSSTSLYPWQIGLISLSAPIGIMSTARLSGKTINSIGGNTLMLIGLGIMGIATLILTNISLHWTLYFLILCLFIYGLGGGIYQPANISVTMSMFLAKNQGSVAGINRMLHNLGNASGVLVSSLLVEEKIGGVLTQGMRWTWEISFLLLFLSLMGVFFIKKMEKLK